MEGLKTVFSTYSNVSVCPFPFLFNLIFSMQLFHWDLIIPNNLKRFPVLLTKLAIYVELTIIHSEIRTSLFLHKVERHW